MVSLDIDWRGLVLPVSYLLVVIGTFATFSSIYRKRKAVQSASLSPWFPPHLQRNIYLSLQQMEPEPGSGAATKPPKVPESVLRAALLRRAVEDIRRIIQIRTGKQACQALLQRGSVGDDLWQRFLRAEKEMEDELRDVVVEANVLVPNWGQIIFQTANAIAGNEALRAKLDAIEVKAPAEKARWATAAAAATTSAAALSSPAAASKTDDDDAVLVDVATPAKTTDGAPAPSPATKPSAPATPSSSRKKKGKK